MFITFVHLSPMNFLGLIVSGASEKSRSLMYSLSLDSMESSIIVACTGFVTCVGSIDGCGLVDLIGADCPLNSCILQVSTA